jgi:hypothetical protein
LASPIMSDLPAKNCRDEFHWPQAKVVNLCGGGSILTVSIGPCSSLSVFYDMVNLIGQVQGYLTSGCWSILTTSIVQSILTIW